MGKLETVINKLRQIDGNRMEAVILSTIKKTEQKLITMNTDQLWAGKRADGMFMPKYRSKKRSTERVQLFRTGDFYFAFYVKHSGWPVTISSRDKKTSILVRGYGKEIFGLDKKHLKEYSELYILPALKREFRRAVGL